MFHALYVAVNELEPNRRLASALKVVIVAVGFAAILTHLMRQPPPGKGSLTSEELSRHNLT
jgi:hypothetical protein